MGGGDDDDDNDDDDGGGVGRIRDDVDENDDEDDGDDSGSISACWDVRNLALDECDGNDDDDIDYGRAIQPSENDFHLEMDHLRGRIERVSLSLSTCRGLSNPHTWRTNCLNPVRNVVREWRCIVAFHHPDGATSIYDDIETDDEYEGGRRVEVPSPISMRDDGDGSNAPVPPRSRRNDVDGNDQLQLRATSTGVFGLIQTSVQIGPLVGSNPGYFKRCGGEVASLAAAFLLDIVELAGVDMNAMIDVEDPKCDHRSSIRNGLRDNRDTNDSSPGRERTEGLFEEREAYAGCDDDESSGGGQSGQEKDVDRRSEESVKSCDVSSSESDSSVSEYCDDETEYLHASIIDDTPRESNPSKRDDLVVSSPRTTRGRVLIDGLQKSLLFTDKQSQKFYQWLCNAEKAVGKDLPPSKSASRLQSLRSKKQTLKELKIQRKLKKKKKKGGR